MRVHFCRSALAGAVCLLATAIASTAEPAFRAATLLPESRLWLVGDSTLHAFASTATQLDVQMKVDDAPQTLPDEIRGGKMRALDVRVPVKGLKSEKAALDRNLWKTLKADANPDITFHMTSYEVQAATAPGTFAVVARGQLTVAGTPEDIDLTATTIGTNVAHITGSAEVLMTHHGIKPPSIMGTIRTRDRIVVNFDLYLK